MLDILVSLFIGFIVSSILLRQLKTPAVLIVAAAVGGLVGWQILTLFPVKQTSLSYLLSTNPELSLIWEQTHDLRYVLRIAILYGHYWLILMNMLAGTVGCFIALKVRRRP